MCESNVYFNRGGNHELFMGKVGRIIPGSDDVLILEDVFGERKIVKAKVLEIELLHHKILLEEITEKAETVRTEIWLEPQTDHGHFHSGEEVRLVLHAGYNMQRDENAPYGRIEAFMVKDGRKQPVSLVDHHGVKEINLGCEEDGLITVCARTTDERLLSKVIVEIGHHHHHSLEPVGLPLEIVPAKYSHVHLGDNYEIQVLKNGTPLAGADVYATYGGRRGQDYPYHKVTDEEGKTRVMLSARGNWLFSVSDENTTSTFTLVKDF